MLEYTPMFSLSLIDDLRASRFLLVKWTMKPEAGSRGHKVRRLVRVWTTFTMASSLDLYPVK